jgi:redox-sensitive bicupin YhaK (pirin superfamily)
MITVRHQDERGQARLGWLDSRHSFSFGDYFDPHHSGFRALRVINEDRVAPGRGFEAHSHRDMEIISYVLEGALEHKDSLGTGAVIRPGDVQRMSAGTGITHSEFNPSADAPVHFLQIWIIPAERGLRPSYEQTHFSGADRRDRLKLVGAPDGRDGAVTIHQDANLYVALLGGGRSVEHAFAEDRFGWIQVARGAVSANGIELSEGDGAAIRGETAITITGEGEAEVLLFDLS